MPVRTRIGKALSRPAFQDVLVCTLALFLVFGEAGASTESRISFLVSGWKVGVVLIVACLLVASSSGELTRSVKAYFKNPLVRALCVVFALMLVDSLVAAAANGGFSFKGIVRSFTFYGAVMLAGYCACRLLDEPRRLALFRSACRVCLLCFLILAFFEIVTDIHLPGNRLTDPALLTMLNEQDLNVRWYVATGIFYNENNFSVFLVVLAALSLPSYRDRRCVQAFSLVLTALVLVEASVVGATIATVALFAAYAVWLFAMPWRMLPRLLLLAGFVAIALWVSTPASHFIMWGAEVLGFPPPTDLSAGEVGLISSIEGQADNFEQGMGSTWKRLTMYGDLAGLALSHPFGVGPGMLASHFASNPSLSGLSNPHNWWLEFLCSYGFPAAVAYVAFLAYALVLMVRRYRSTGQYDCLVAVVSYIAVGIGSIAPSSFDYMAYSWIPVLLALSSLQVGKREEARGLVAGKVDPSAPVRVLFVAFKDLDAPATSASIKRPREMLRAFREMGCEVTVLEGLPNRYMERTRNVSSLMRTIRQGRQTFDLCYVEPPAGPMLCRRDLSLLRLIRRRGIPLGYFYRDAYWLTRDALEGATFKQRVIYHLSKQDFKTFNKAATIVYHPGVASASWAMKAAASKGCPYRAKAGVLPPGCESEPVREKAETKGSDLPTAIYVGAADERYGTPLLLDAFSKVNADAVVCRLVFVCPERQWEGLDDRYRDLKRSADWLKVEHLAAGEGLAEVYARADFGCMSYRRCEYNDAAIPVKMFEYLTYRKPIVTTDIPGAASFVEQWELGLVVPDDAASYAAAIERFASEPDLLARYRSNADRAAPLNAWIVRAVQVCSDLVGDDLSRQPTALAE